MVSDVKVPVRQSVEALQGAPESALLPLLSRALESRRERPIVRDEKAEAIVDSLDYDFPRLEGKSLYHTIISLRVRRFDEVVARFLKAHPDGVVVNVGCGLDTRYERLDNGRAQWIEVDFPSVISLRKRFLEEGPRRTFVAASAADAVWLERLALERGRPHLFFAEGVLMFMKEPEVRELFSRIRRLLAGSEIVFDAVKPLEVATQRLHPTLASTSARFQWGLGSARSLTTWGDHIEVLDEWYYCRDNEPRLGSYRLLRFFPILATARIVHLRLGKKI